MKDILRTTERYREEKLGNIKKTTESYSEKDREKLIDRKTERQREENFTYLSFT